jgi:hypothetical protein
MKDDNPVGTLHRAMSHAAYLAFGDYNYQDRDWEAYAKGDKNKTVTKTRTHTDYDLTVVAMFPQTWGSTALGFGGIGGAAMSTAYTCVIESDLVGGMAVYFGGRFAYKIDRPNQKMMEDISRQCMSAVKDARELYEH